LDNISRNSPNSLFYLLWIGAITAYFLPWVVTPGMSLHLGAYDLAEWVSLILPQRPLTTVMLLRIPPLCLAMIAALLLGQVRFSWHWWIGLMIVVITSTALLPPFEFISQRDDVNYRQQFLIAVSTLIVGLVCLTPLLDRVRGIAVPVVGVIAIGVSIAGLGQAQTFMQELALPIETGAGGILFPLIVALMGMYALIRSGGWQRHEGIIFRRIGKSPS
jgi:hypothetical protein